MDISGPVQLPHLETFALAAELSSFTAAARALGLSQAAVSQRIQALEKAVAVPLFRRQAGRVLLTEAGHKLYDYAERILQLHQQARRQLGGQKPQVAGDLLIGASTVPGEHLLPALLPGFRQRFPKVRVRVRAGDSLEVIELLEQRKIQLGLVGRKVDQPHLEFRPFATDRMVLVVAASHPWRKRRSLGLKQLLTQPLILREPGSGLRHCFEKALESQGHSLNDLNVVLELGSNEAIKTAVLGGQGVAILSIYAVRKELETGQLAAMPVRNVKCDRQIHVVLDTRRPLPAPARAFLHYLETHPLRETAP